METKTPGATGATDESSLKGCLIFVIAVALICAAGVGLILVFNVFGPPTH